MRYSLVTAITLVAFCAPANAQNSHPKANWRSIEAADGAVVKIDMNSIFRPGAGVVDVVVYFVQGTGYDPRNMRRMIFYCDGRFRDVTDGIQPTEYAGPKSVAGQIASTVCTKNPTVQGYSQ